MTDKIVYFLRHGQAESNANHFFAGQGDVPLTEKGVAEAIATAPLLQHISFDKVYCSDLQRARHTAALALPHVTCTYTSRIREIDVGTLAFQYFTDCENRYGELFANSRANGDYSPFGGESREMLDTRIRAFLEELTQADEGAVIGVVCHGGVMQSVARYVLGSSRGLAMSDNCGISVFRIKDGEWKLHKWNVTVEL